MLEQRLTTDPARPSVTGTPRRLMMPATIGALHDALSAYPDQAVLEQKLRPAAGMVCDDARGSGLRVEQMLVALKSDWAMLVETHRIPHGDARTDLTSRFITLCIHAFYASQRAPLADGPPDRNNALGLA